MKEAKKGTQRLYKVRQEARAALRRSRSIRDWEGFPNKQNRQSLANVIACYFCITTNLKERRNE